ncbi:hypothetical protein ACFE04_029069 [Oxalis oulophora]
MADDASSVVSDTKIYNLGVHRLDETSEDSSNSSMRSSKRARHNNYHENDINISIAISNGNVNVARFKGVVPQQNGHWGAQIYANHQRIWLGTFKSEKEAAMAYDSALIKLRSKDSHRNFTWDDRSIQEPSFQNRYTTEEILNMIKDGSYKTKFADYLSNLSQREDIVQNPSGSSLHSTMVHGNVQFSCMQLFQKELTPSDVGKLNRLVIPKKYAVKYFRQIKNYNDKNPEINFGGLEDIELVFYDKSMTDWKFRYCYWRSSQSFVFTRGWNRFVKEKKLKEKDVITFYKCTSSSSDHQDIINGQQSFMLIDVNYCGEDQHKCKSSGQESKLDLELKLEQNFGSKSKEYNLENINIVEEKGFRLFGVQIKSQLS